MAEENIRPLGSFFSELEEGSGGEEKISKANVQALMQYIEKQQQQLEEQKRMFAEQFAEQQQKYAEQQQQVVAQQQMIERHNELTARVSGMMEILTPSVIRMKTTELDERAKFRSLSGREEGAAGGDGREAWGAGAAGGDGRAAWGAGAADGDGRGERGAGAAGGADREDASRRLPFEAGTFARLSDPFEDDRVSLAPSQSVSEAGSRESKASTASLGERKQEWSEEWKDKQYRQMKETLFALANTVELKQQNPHDLTPLNPFQCETLVNCIMKLLGDRDGCLSLVDQPKETVYREINILYQRQLVQLPPVESITALALDLSCAKAVDQDLGIHSKELMALKKVAPPAGDFGDQMRFAERMVQQFGLLAYLLNTVLRNRVINLGQEAVAVSASAIMERQTKHLMYIDLSNLLQVLRQVSCHTKHQQQWLTLMTEVEAVLSPKRPQFANDPLAVAKVWGKYVKATKAHGEMYDENTMREQRDKLRAEFKKLHQNLSTAVKKIAGLWAPLKNAEVRDCSSEYSACLVQMVHDSAYEYHQVNHSYWEALKEHDYKLPVTETSFLDANGNPIAGCFDRLLDILSAHAQVRAHYDASVQLRKTKQKQEQGNLGVAAAAGSQPAVAAASTTVQVEQKAERETAKAAKKAAKAARAAAAQQGTSSATSATSSPGATAVPAVTTAARDPNDKVCYNCHAPGHLATDCPKPKKCSKCGNAGHLAATCRSAKKCAQCTKAGRPDEHYPRKCFHVHPCPCGRAGHLLEQCFHGGKAKDPKLQTAKQGARTTARAHAAAASPGTVSTTANDDASESEETMCPYCESTEHVAKDETECPMAVTGGQMDAEANVAAIAYARARGVIPVAKQSKLRQATPNAATQLYAKGAGGMRTMTLMLLVCLAFPQSSEAALPINQGLVQQCIPASVSEDMLALSFLVFISVCFGLARLWNVLCTVLWPTPTALGQAGCALGTAVKRAVQKSIGGTQGLWALALLCLACPVQVAGFATPCGILRPCVGGLARDTGAVARAYAQSLKLREIYRMQLKASPSLEVVDPTGGVQRHLQKPTGGTARFNVHGSKTFVRELRATQQNIVHSTVAQVQQHMDGTGTEVLMFLFDPHWMRVFESPQDVMVWLKHVRSDPVRAWSQVAQVADRATQTRVWQAVADSAQGSCATLADVDGYLDLRLQSLLEVGRRSARGGLLRSTNVMRVVKTYFILRKILKGEQELRPWIRQLEEFNERKRCSEVIVDISRLEHERYNEIVVDIPTRYELTRERLIAGAHSADLELQRGSVMETLHTNVLTRTNLAQQGHYHKLGIQNSVLPAPASAVLSETWDERTETDEQQVCADSARASVPLPESKCESKRVLACPTSAYLQDLYVGDPQASSTTAYSVLGGMELLLAMKDVNLAHEDSSIETLVDDVFFDEQGNPLTNGARAEGEEACSNEFVCAEEQQGQNGQWQPMFEKEQHVWPEAGVPVQAHSAVFENEDHVLYMADSGCDTHLCKVADGFTNYRSCAGHVQTADASGKTPIVGCGNLTIEAKTNQSFVSMMLEGVLVVPELHQNLLSVSRLRDAGYNVFFTDVFSGIVKGKLVVPFKMINRLYYIEVKVKETAQMKTVALDMKGVPTASAMSARVAAHQRFGHLNIAQAHRLKDAFRDAKIKVDGIPLRCECCTLAKATLQPSRKLAVEKPTECAQRVSVDTAGPFSIPSMGAGARYFTCFKDDYSGYVVTFVHRTRAGRVAMFQKYINLCGRYGYQVKCFRMDQAREFTCQPFTEYLEARGVTLEYSAPYHASSNGSAERTVRTCKEGLRAALIDSKAPLSWWSYALLDFVAKYNCFPSREVVDTQGTKTLLSPYEIFHKHKPESKFLQRFGCGAMMSIGRERASDSSLGARAVQGIHLGTASPYGVKGGLVFCPETRKIFTGTTIAYNHDQMPFAARDAVRKATVLDQLVDEEGVEPEEDVDENLIRRFCENAQPSTLDDYSEGDSPFADTYDENVEDVIDVGDLHLGYEDFEELDHEFDEIAKDLPYNIASGGGSESMTMTPEDEAAIEEVRGNVELRRSTRRARGVERYKPGRVAAAAAALVVPRAYANLAKGEADEKCSCMSCRVIARERNKARVLESEEWARANKAGVSLAPKETGRVRKVTYSQAMKSKESRFLWEPVIASEVAQFLQDNRVEYVPRPKDYPVLKSFFVLTEKYDTSNKLQKLKSRLVVDGSKQVYGRDCGQTYSPTVPAQFRNMLLSIAAANDGYFVELDDVKGAFLASPLKADNDKRNHFDLYMEIPPGYKDAENPNYVWRANAAVYGAKGSPRAFNKKLTAVFEKNGYRNVLSDNTLFVKRVVGNGFERVHIVCSFVDDLMTVSNSVELVEAMREFLLEEGLEISCTQSSRESNHLEYTGIDMDYDESTQSWYMSQRALIDEIVDRVQRSDPSKLLYTRRTPFPLDGFDAGECPEIPDESKVKFFRWFVGSCLYLCQSRPDISYTVAELSRVVRSPSEKHVDMAWQLAGYLKNTRSAALRFGKPQNQDELNKLDCFSDASFADCVHTRRSQSGIVVMLNGNPIYWRSKRASLVALSSTEAEYVALAMLCKEVKWLTMALEELGFPQLTPCGVKVNVDNTAAIKIAEGSQSRERSKHFSLRWHYCREMQHAGYIELKYVNTKMNPADLLTKALPIETHRLHASTLLGNPLTFNSDAKGSRADAAAESAAAART